MASDGLWDVCCHEEVAVEVHSRAQQGESPERIAKEVVKYGLDKGTKDNITVLIIILNWSNVSLKHRCLSNMPVIVGPFARSEFGTRTENRLKQSF